jgi:CRISPR-associated endoribonuclease Cas6
MTEVVGFRAENNMITTVQLRFQPVEAGTIPHSTGHILYAGILDMIQQHDEQLSTTIHGEERSGLTLSPLKGEFRRANRDRKDVFSDSEYRAELHLLNHSDAFTPLFNELAIQDTLLTVGDAEFVLSEIESAETTFEDLIDTSIPRNLHFHFTSPVSIQYQGGDVTEMFPHREAVFRSLHHSWTQHAPDQYHFDLPTAAIKEHVAAQPDADSYRTHNVVVTRRHDKEKGHDRPLKAFGFTGKVTYTFMNADDTLKQKLAILTRWAEYAGVGGHTARGCGNVNTTVDF